LLFFILLYILLTFLFFINLYRNGEHLEQKHLWLFFITFIFIAEIRIVMYYTPDIFIGSRKLNYVVVVSIIHIMCYAVILFPSLFLRVEEELFSNLKGEHAENALTILSWVILILLNIALLIVYFFVQDSSIY